LRPTSNRPRFTQLVAVGASATLMAGLAVTATTASASGASVAPASAGTASAPTAAAPRIPRLSWTPCDDGFQCATARVPLDYRHPRGTTISIAVIRHLAAHRARHARTLFVNAGGPTEQIEPIVAEFGAIPAALRVRFNIVTFDMRGFGLSSAVRCFPNAPAENKFLAGLPPFPVGARQVAVWERTWARFDALCARKNGRLLRHDTSTDVARDMNLLRQAMGIRKLNYLGLSWATGLGAIYANLFPATVGHMVLDGNVDPVAWSKGGRLPDSLREGEDLATASVMRSFLNLCGKAATPACAFSAGTPAGTRAKFAALLHHLRQQPVTIGNPHQTFTYADTVSDVPPRDVSDWQSAAVLLQQLWAASKGNHAPVAAGTADLSTAEHGIAGPAATAPAVYTGLEQTYAEVCADTADPRGTRAYEAAARLAAARAGGFGLDLTWTEEPCADWPAAASRDRYRGPWNHRTANPILVIGNTGDPVTPYRGAVAMSRDLARARLLTVDGFGHTEFFNPSTCATNYEISYLESGTLPPARTVCQQDAQPFPAP
jgi:pimeloyl-ACP methyl ester carboxylesterase